MWRPASSPIQTSPATRTCSKYFHRDTSPAKSIPVLLAQREQLRAEIKAREARCEVIETELKFLMGDAEIIAGLPDWHVTYKAGNRKEYVVPAKLLRPLRIIDRRPDASK